GPGASASVHGKLLSSFPPRPAPLRFTTPLAKDASARSQSLWPATRFSGDLGHGSVTPGPQPITPVCKTRPSRRRARVGARRTDVSSAGPCPHLAETFRQRPEDHATLRRHLDAQNDAERATATPARRSRPGRGRKESLDLWKAGWVRDRTYGPWAERGCLSSSDGVEVPFLRHSPERVRPSILEAEAGSRDEVDDRSRDEHLTGPRLIHDPRAQIHRETADITVEQLQLSSVEAAPDLEIQCPDGLGYRACTVDGACRPVERGESSVACVFDDRPAKPF